MSNSPGKSICANPRSMEMPRRFSSSRRSVSMPVSALTRDVFPWSMCPAVPTMMCLMGTLRILLSAWDQPALVQEAFTFKSAVSNVRIDAQVMNRGQVVPDLTPQDFVVFDNNLPQQLLY